MAKALSKAQIAALVADKFRFIKKPLLYSVVASFRSTLADALEAPLLLVAVNRRIQIY